MLSLRPGFAWLDGGLERGREGRYSFLGVEPVETRRGLDAWGMVGGLSTAAHDHDHDSVNVRVPVPDLSCIARDGGEDRDDTTNENDRVRARSPGETLIAPEDVPLWIGYISYDACWAGRKGARHPRDAAAPVVLFSRYDALLAFDHELGHVFLVGDDAAACERLRRVLDGPAASELAYTIGEVEVTHAAAHRAAIERALEQIGEGDFYLINLARRYRASFAGSAFGLALRMRALSPVPLGLFLDGGDRQVIGRSMERFLRLRRSDQTLWTSPIKGTIASEEQAAADRLLRADPKELAEHAMLVDLMRNDLGRVARYGSVRIAELMSVQSFAGLSHLVSTITCQVPPEVTLAAVLEATFPPGSVTGTPKERAVQRIEELEPHARGLYTGAYGFIDRAGGISLAVAIRTAVVEHGHVEYWAGGGIVADSVPSRELAETDLKAQVFLDARPSG